MHLITVKLGVVVFNRQLFIYLDGPSIGISLDISRHTLLTLNEIKVIMIHILSISFDIKLIPLIILSSVNQCTQKMYSYD